MGRSVHDMEPDDLWEEKVEVQAVTAKALLVRYEGEDQWIPLSQVHKDSEVTKKGDSGLLIIPLWLAKEKGWVED